MATCLPHGVLGVVVHSWVISKGRLTMEEILFSLKHYWRFLWTAKSFELTALSRGGRASRMNTSRTQRAKPAVCDAFDWEHEVEAGDGEKRTFTPGSVLLVTDVDGMGHKIKVVGDQAVLLVWVPIP